MTSELIQKFVENKSRKGTNINIHFKQRNMVSGIFINGNDYNELKSKNFWRIVTGNSLEEWKKTSNMELARIFKGDSFSRLTEQ